MRSLSATGTAEGLGSLHQSAPVGPIVWALGGGKGGVGKSVITASLAIAFARSGQRCAVVDADLGGANLHTLLGMPRPPRTLFQFLNGQFDSLSEAMCRTSVPDVWLVSGARAWVEAANPQLGQKRKLLRAIGRLGVDHVLLDLGAGTSVHVLDFFLAAQRGILVVIPEPTSIENAYHFLKAVFYRSLRTVARRDHVRTAIERALGVSEKGRTQSPRALLSAVETIDREAGALLRARAATLSPMLIVNQSSFKHRQVGREIAAACKAYLGIEVEDLGALEVDECVPAATARRQPVFQLFPTCPFATGVAAVADRLLEALVWKRRIGGMRQERGQRDDTVSLATYSLLDDCESPWAARRPEEDRPEAERQPAPARGLPPIDLAEPGRYLRRCREALGLGLAELTERTRIRRLDSIENEHFHELPDEPYLSSYVREYARVLGVSAVESLVASFRQRARRAEAAD